MKRLLVTIDGTELGMLESRLEKIGIPCVVRDEMISQAIHTQAFPAELWILDDEDYPRAAELCRAWQHPAAEIGPAWTCPACGERLDGQFGACWKCGPERDAEDPIRPETAGVRRP